LGKWGGDYGPAGLKYGKNGSKLKLTGLSKEAPASILAGKDVQCINLWESGGWKIAGN